MGGFKRWMTRLAWAAGLPWAFGGAAAAQEPLLFKSVEYSVRYQQTSSLLAMTTQCGRLAEYQGYDKDRAIIDYQNARNFLEEVSPGYRVFAEFETFRMLKELNEAQVARGEEGLMAYCRAVAPALVGPYRNLPAK